MASRYLGRPAAFFGRSITSDPSNGRLSGFLSLSACHTTFSATLLPSALSSSSSACRSSSRMSMLSSPLSSNLGFHQVRHFAAKARSEGGEDRLIFDIKEALRLLRACAVRTWDETVEIGICLGVDPRKPNQAVRGVAKLPNGTGKSIRIAVFAKGDKADEARRAGADVVGDADLADKISKGELNFERCIASPDMMGVVGRVARILGPRGLMPNPKLGTVTNNIVEAIKNAKQGQVEFKADKNGTLHAPCGKISFSNEALYDNICALVEQVGSARPSGARGTYFRQAHLATSMGPGVQITVNEWPFKPKRQVPGQSIPPPTLSQTA